MFLCCALGTVQATIHMEAETGRLAGVAVETKIAGYRGQGYVTGWDQEGDHLEFRFRAKAGLYSLSIRYHASQEKGFEVAANERTSGGMFEATGSSWRTHWAGKVELREGANTLKLNKGWGWYDVDWIELTPAVVPVTLAKPPRQLADRRAGREAKGLHQRLLDAYGKAMFSGQYGAEDCALVKRLTGRLPAIRGGDFMEYSPSRAERGADNKQESEKLIAAARAGQIITISWHWNAPTKLIDKMITDAQGRQVDAKWYKGFYSNATTFDVAAALADPASQDYRLLLRDIDAISGELKKFQKARVPVLWRPLHEADGSWFWWGAKGPEPFKQLWRLMFNRMTKIHKLHNLIWVANVVKPDWYPGDDVVDVVGVDAYPSDVSDPLSGTWESLQARVKGKKLLAITEFGGVPDPDRAFRFGAKWSYFVSWLGDQGPKKMSSDDLSRIYRSSRTLNAPIRSR